MKLKKLILNYFPVIFGLTLVFHYTIPTLMSVGVACAGFTLAVTLMARRRSTRLMEA